MSAITYMTTNSMETALPRFSNANQWEKNKKKSKPIPNPIPIPPQPLSKSLITQNNPCDGENKARHGEEEQGDKIPRRPFPDRLGLDTQTFRPSKRVDLLQQVEFDPLLLQFLNALGQELPVLFLPLQ
jgi:hypothetical protein